MLGFRGNTENEFPSIALETTMEAHDCLFFIFLIPILLFFMKRVNLACFFFIFLIPILLFFYEKSESYMFFIPIHQLILDLSNQTPWNTQPKLCKIHSCFKIDLLICPNNPSFSKRPRRCHQLLEGLNFGGFVFLGVWILEGLFSWEFEFWMVCFSWNFTQLKKN